MQTHHRNLVPIRMIGSRILAFKLLLATNVSDADSRACEAKESLTLWFYSFAFTARAIALNCQAPRSTPCMCFSQREAFPSLGLETLCRPTEECMHVPVCTALGHIVPQTPLHRHTYETYLDPLDPSAALYTKVDLSQLPAFGRISSA